MVSGSAVSDADAGGRQPTGAFAARAFQWLALCNPLRHRLASDAERLAAVVFDLSTDAALAGGGRIRGARSGFAGGPAPGLGTPRGSDRGDHRQSDPAFDSGKRLAGRL